MKSGNSSGQNWSRKAVAACKVCMRAKHTCKWGEMRRTKRSDASKTRGATCYCCMRAILALQVDTRSYDVWSQVEGALDVWKSQSKVEQAKVSEYSGDLCTCSECAPAPKPEGEEIEG